MNTHLLTKLSEISNKRMVSHGDGVSLTVWIETLKPEGGLEYTKAKDFDNLKDAEAYFDSLS